MRQRTAARHDQHLYQSGILRIDFAEKDENLEEIEWGDFFAIFDDRKLAFLYEDAGHSRFNKFVDAEQNA